VGMHICGQLSSQVSEEVANQAMILKYFSLFCSTACFLQIVKSENYEAHVTFTVYTQK
jgi:hypothetical protein